MANPNGWRSINTLGGGEIISLKVLLSIKEFDWYIITTNQLINKMNLDSELTHFLKMKNVKFLPIPLIFSKTNVIGDIFQGLYYFIQSLKLSFKLRSRINLTYASTNNFLDVFPAKITSFITSSKLIIKYHISMYSGGNIFILFKNYLREKNGILDSFIRSILASITLIIFRSSDKIISVSIHLFNQLKNCGVGEDKLIVNYNGVDINYLKKFVAINKKIYDICYIGRIEKNKGIQDIVRLIDYLSKNYKSKINTIIIGDGSYFNEVSQLIKQKKLQDNIKLTGYMGEDRYNLLQQSKLFLSPSYALEGFGLSILESLYLKVPVIAYTNEVFKEIFGKDRNIKLIEPDLQTLIHYVKHTLSKKNAFFPDKLVFNYSLKKCIFREKTILLSML